MNKDDLLRQSVAIMNSLAVERNALAAKLGQQFGGDRDIYEAAGYKKDLTFTDYFLKYDRQDIAGRIVDAPADATWQTPPNVQDINADGQPLDSEFAKAWKSLVSVTEPGDKLEDADRKSIFHYLHRADKLAGIGRYGGILVGISDGQTDLETPLQKTQNGKLLYLTPYNEGAITVTKWNEDKTSPRYNLPEVYEINGDADSNMDGTPYTTEGIKAHWSRVIHIAEGLQNNDVFGTPRLKGIYNRLDDLEKVMAGGGEAAWRLMNKGYIFSTKDGYELPEDTAALDASIEKFIHELSRTVQLEGMDTTVLGGEIVDPSPLIRIYVAVISAKVGIPQRILLGSEAGHLASDQDERNWRQKIQSRQTNFAEPVILRPLIARLIFAGVLPKPQGRLKITWNDNQVMTEAEEAANRLTMAQAMSAAKSAGMPLTTYLRYVMEWSADQITEMYQEAEREQLLGFGDVVTGVEQ